MSPNYILVSGNTLDIIFEAGLSSAKPATMPIEQNHSLAKDKGPFLCFPDQYHCLVGSLIYLTITRPKLAYSIHILEQFMQAPHHHH